MSEVIRLGNIYNENAGLGFAGNVWDKNGLCPTLTTMQGGGREPMIIEEPKLVGGLGEKVSNGGTQYYNQDRVYDSDGVAVAVATSFNVHHCNMVIVAMRGRNPDNPSDRTPGITTEQRLEPNSEGICNTLTTVQKDNLVLENIVIGGMQEHQSIKDDGVCTTLTSSMGTGGGYVPMVVEEETIIYDDYNSNIPKNQDCIGTLTTNIGSSSTRNEIKIIEKQTARNSEIVKIEKNGFYEQAIKTAEDNNAQEGDIIDAFNQKVLTDGISPTITTRPEGKKTAILPVVERHRIRKLTPRECFRLMNVEEEQFNRAEKVVSNSQLYKVAGNAIVVSVLCALFSQLGIQGKKKWNDMTEDERLQIVHKGTIFEKREENA